jgi:hypothetical protein
MTPCKLVNACGFFRQAMHGIFFMRNNATMHFSKSGGNELFKSGR